ncbi:hypothetical protein Nepgr_002558 [Nepenthes gracilis]|uniref:Pre-mRNA-splicing factor SYF2 n=1 Tax=Nepenthes gracilis TaxID=150966 RepID=A0AAD3P6H4_NEPGR|nr:hypothetical protein Nepgr_002558 [Nepenthes gracilis]
MFLFVTAQAPKISKDKIDKMVQELKDREEKQKSYSRRRKFLEEKDIDSINDRNEHFNKKIERAVGKYTLEIKNNLERGTVRYSRRENRSGHCVLASFIIKQTFRPLSNIILAFNFT